SKLTLLLGRDPRGGLGLTLDNQLSSLIACNLSIIATRGAHPRGVGLFPDRLQIRDVLYNGL
ncbi:MAG: hypothetical protein Q4G68_15015, partial [Planctomycetia bacterium]|nr:hypothetical protein [Planctomycetia bacterium]